MSQMLHQPHLSWTGLKLLHGLQWLYVWASYEFAGEFLAWRHYHNMDIWISWCLDALHWCACSLTTCWKRLFHNVCIYDFFHLHVLFWYDSWAGQVFQNFYHTQHKYIQNFFHVLTWNGNTDHAWSKTLIHTGYIDVSSDFWCLDGLSLCGHPAHACEPNTFHTCDIGTSNFHAPVLCVELESYYLEIFCHKIHISTVGLCESTENDSSRGKVNQMS